MDRGGFAYSAGRVEGESMFQRRRVANGNRCFTAERFKLHFLSLIKKILIYFTVILYNSAKSGI